MRKDLEFDTRRFKFVYLTCEELYYDSNIKMFCCAETTVKFKDVNRCKKCKLRSFHHVICDDAFYGGSNA